MKSTDQNFQKGFTLIELVSVIVILAVLSAFALPRFADISEEGHEAVYQGAFASFKTAVKVYRAAWVASGASGQIANLSSYGNGSIDSSETGYPAGTSFSGSLTGANCNELWQNLIDSNLSTRASLGGSFDGNTDTPIKYWYGGNGADQTAFCYYIYVGYRNDPGVMLPTLRYFPVTGVIQETRAAYSN